MSPKFKLDSEQQKSFVSKAYLSNAELAELFDIGKRTVSEYRKRLKAPRTYSRRTYNFKYPENEFRLGWSLGLFATDGHLNVLKHRSSEMYRIVLCLTESDKETVFISLIVFLLVFLRNLYKRFLSMQTLGQNIPKSDTNVFALSIMKL